MAAKIRGKFPFKAFTERFAQCHFFQKFDWFLFFENPPDYWRYRISLKAFSDDFNVTSYSTEDSTMIS